ncbi:Nanos-like protein 1 [Trichoplax sp. H2]|nr:Nanos-like protein 1 [Trichoplax sp. H2]|eukprot:RDD42367.1 Nanos-like protein 1 [Trichoplax sp. H2]
MLKTLPINTFNKDSTLPDDSGHDIKMNEDDLPGTLHSVEIDNLINNARQSNQAGSSSSSSSLSSSMNDPSSLFKIEGTKSNDGTTNNSTGNHLGNSKDKALYDATANCYREFKLFHDYFGLINLIVKKKAHNINSVNGLIQQQAALSNLDSKLNSLWAPSDTSFSANSNNNHGGNNSYFTGDLFNNLNGLNRSDPHRSRFDSLESEMSSLASSNNGTPTFNNENEPQHFSFAESRSLPKMSTGNNGNSMLFQASHNGNMISKSASPANSGLIRKEVGASNANTPTAIQRRNVKQRVNPRQVCVFCRNNGEHEDVYTSHQLKDADGKITCPILKAYTCPICGATGENSHTIKYCPSNKETSLGNGTNTTTAVTTSNVATNYGYSNGVSNGQHEQQQSPLFSGNNSDIKKIGGNRSRQQKYGIH